MCGGHIYSMNLSGHFKLYLNYEQQQKKYTEHVTVTFETQGLPALNRQLPQTVIQTLTIFSYMSLIALRDLTAACRLIHFKSDQIFS